MAQTGIAIHKFEFLEVQQYELELQMAIRLVRQVPTTVSLPHRDL